MPQRNNSEPPKVMTWPEASPALAIAGLSDLLRAFFTLFWFFGPALADLYCSDKVSGWVGSLWGFTKVACEAAAVAGGVYFSPIIASFGVVMASAMALLGFLALVFWILGTNFRILKTVRTAVMQIGASFGIGVVPIIGAIPAFSFTVFRLYRRQIKLEKAAYAKWEKETAAIRQQQRNQQIMQIRGAQQMQFQQGQMMQQEAAYEQEQADVQQRRIVEREEAEYADYQQQLAANEVGSTKSPKMNEGRHNRPV